MCCIYGVVTNRKIYILVLPLINMIKEAQNYGTAYAFFSCNDPIEKVHKEVKNIASNLLRDTQSKLELSLKKMPDFRKSINDRELVEALDTATLNFGPQSKKKPIKMSELKYALTAKYRPGTNEDAGDALCIVMNGLYFKYNSDMFLTSPIVGKGSDGHYVTWENE